MQHGYFVQLQMLKAVWGNVEWEDYPNILHVYHRRDIP